PAAARRLPRAVARRWARLVAHRDGRLREPRPRQQRALRRRVRDRAARDHGRLSRDHEAPRGVRVALMETRATRIGLWAWGALVVAFLWIPLGIMALYAFNSSKIHNLPNPVF